MCCKVKLALEQETLALGLISGEPVGSSDAIIHVRRPVQYPVMKSIVMKGMAVLGGQYR